MNPSEKMAIEIATAKNLVEMIQKRLNNRVEQMNTLSGTPMDQLSDEVKKMREEEAAKLRAVTIEQKDIIDIIKMLFPGA